MTFINHKLSNQFVSLEPLQESHLPALKQVVADGQLWQLMATSVPHPDAMDAFYQLAMQQTQAGVAQVFATLDANTGDVVGSTRYLNTDWAHQRTEIGFTFIAKSQQRTPINTAAKLLMLTHAFETLKFNRVAFLTDYLNQPSRQAILRLGAKQEGIMRNHMVMADGRIRDTVVFSIAKHEWPGVKSFIQHKLER